MTDVPTNPGPGEPAPAREPVSWRTHWQAPVFLLALLVLAAGIITAVLTAPKPDVTRILGRVGEMLQAEKFQPALDVLNRELLPYYNAGDLSPAQRREFHTLRARAMHLAQLEKGLDLEENAKRIADEYAEAVPAATELQPMDRYYLAGALVTLKKFHQAVDLANSLPADHRVQRGKVIKRVVQGLLAATDFDAEATLKLLTDFLGERELTPGDRGWALARQAELLLRQGLTTSAVTKILQTMPSLLTELDRDQLGELYLLLGRAYYETEALTEAARQLNLASQLLLPSDARHAQAMVLLGRVDEQVGDPIEEGRAQAKVKYAGVVERFAGTTTRLPALLGLGEVNSALGDVPASIAAFSELVDELSAKRSHPDASVPEVTQSLMTCAVKCFDAGRMDLALDYTALAERLYSPDSVPPEVLVMVARAHRRAAESLFQGSSVGRERIVELSRLDPATREQVRQHLVAAGRYFKKHADRIGIHDNAGYGRSIWMAADCYDHAGDADQAIPLFSDYVKFFPAEQQQPEARYRLARAYQARGDYATAEDLYRKLIEEGSEPGNMAGPFGDASHVPLAQCFMVDGDALNDAQAEELLQRVVQGHAGGTSTPQFREALLELGRLRAAKGDYPAAIQLLNEAATRFPDSALIDGIRFELAESFRHDARAILKTLGEAMPDARRQALTAARAERLDRAAELYDQVRKSLEARDPRRLSKLEQMHLRNSYFYVADCEFELKKYESAIARYDAAREKYSGDPASLVAMVQIVNAYVEQGDMKRAATAQERARRFYESLPLAVWSDASLPMGQDDWKRWLKSMNSLKPINESGTPATAAVPTPARSDGH